MTLFGLNILNVTAITLTAVLLDFSTLSDSYYKLCPLIGTTSNTVIFMGFSPVTYPLRALTVMPNVISNSNSNICNALVPILRGEPFL